MVYGSDKLIRCCRTAAAVVNGITTILVHGKMGVSRVELIPTQIMIYLSNALLMHVTEYHSGQSSAQIGDTPAGINQPMLFVVVFISTITVSPLLPSTTTTRPLL